MLEKPCSRNHQIKDYIDQLFGQEDSILIQTRQRCKAAGLSEIQVPAHVGKLLYLLTKMQCCSRILELGTLGGYSSICLARALAPQGKLISLELEPKHAAIAKQNLEDAGLKERVEIRIGNASDLLSQMIVQNEQPFDLIFIDADKENNRFYLDACIQLARSGTLILIDNLIPRGEEVGYPANREAGFIYAFNTYLAQHPKLETGMIPSVVQNSGRLDCLGMAWVK